MATTKSCDQLDLGPRRVGIHFRKPACRSVACGEVLGWGLAGTSPPAHDRQALLMKKAVLPVADALRRLSEAFRGPVLRLGRLRAATAIPRVPRRTSGRSVLARRSNKAMQLTRGGWKRGVASCSAVIASYGCHREGPSKVSPLAADRRCWADQG